MASKTLGFACVAAVCAPVFACTAEIDGPTGGTPPAGSAGATSVAGSGAAGGPDTRPSSWEPGVSGDPNAVGALPLSLITRDQYDNSVALIFRDEYGVLPAAIEPAKVLPGETLDQSGFLSVGELNEVNVLRYMDAARAVTDAIASQLDELVGCDLATVADDETCVRAFVTSFGELLYRRPLEPAEVDEHLAFYADEQTTLMRAPEAAAIQLIQAMLQSPYFLCRWEQGWLSPEKTATAARLNPYQVASRLSFLFWGSGPDRALLGAARDGELSTTDGITRQARAMLRHPRAALALDSFHRQWLGLASLDTLFKDEARFPEWTATLSNAMRDEIQAFTRHVMLEGDGKVATLLGAPFSFLNADLAKIYGVSGITGTELRRVELEPTQRAGLLTMPGLLAVAAEPSVPNPFKRGKLLFEKVQCQKLEPPPVVPPLPAPDAQNPQPVRTQLEALTRGQPCSACHELINPLGFGLGNFDAIGRYQTTDDAGFPIDASGKLRDGSAFQTPGELAAALANDPQVRACLTKQWFRFGFGHAESEADTHSLQTAYSSFEGAAFDLRELLIAFVTTRSFLYRSVEMGEVLQ
jgi:hypothetical protein